MELRKNTWMQMDPAAVRGTGAASFCPNGRNTRKSRAALALILDTMVMVSIFVILAGEALAAVLLLAGLLIILARTCRAQAPKERLLSV